LLRAIVLDVEGTTTPISFVYDTLVPYARAGVRRYLDAHAGSPECQSILERLRLEHEADARQAIDVPKWTDTTVAARDDSVVRYATWLMDRNRKSPALKDLQGRIWEEGYRTGAFVGELFDDVAPALHRWQQQGIGAGIFSSGSVLAQKLLFRHSVAGDLTPFLRWHFDTSTGTKTDPESYRRIASTLAASPSRIVFVSDVVRELDAAHAAGLQTVLCLRPGNTPLADGQGYSTIHSFDELRFDG
jgi:enolase-phosphatase E1